MPWPSARLADIVLSTRLRNPRAAPNAPFQYVDVSSISRESLSIRNATPLLGRDAPSRARKEMKAGDVLFATVRPALRRIAVVPPELDGQICSTAFCVVRANPHFADNGFLFFSTLLDTFVAAVAEHQRGSSYPAVTDGQVLSQRVPIPPLPEQRAIAAVLRTVQRAKEACERVIGSMQQLKQSLLQHLFTGVAVPLQSAATAKLKETSIGRLPERWKIVPLKEVASLLSGGTPSKKIPAYWCGAVPWASPKDLKVPRLFDTEDHVSGDAVESGSTLVPAGSIFVVIRGMILNRDVPIALAMVPMAFNQDMKAIVPSRRVDSVFLLYALEVFKNALVSQIGTSAHGTRRLSTSSIADLLVPVLPIEEQREIAGYLTAVDAKLGAEQARRAALETLFKSLLHHLMTGKVRLPADYVRQFEDAPLAAEREQQLAVT